MHRAFQSLRSRTCVLYRRASDDDSSFPKLQPHFNVILMQFFLRLCGDTTVIVSVDQMTTSFLRRLADDAVDYLWNVVTTLPATSTCQVEHVLEQVVQHWRDWEGVVTMVDAIADHLNRYHVRHHSLPTLTEEAYCSFMLSFENKVRNDYNAADLPPRRLLGRLSTVATQLGPNGRALLLEAVRANTKLETLSEISRIRFYRRLEIPYKEGISPALALRQEYMECELQAVVDRAKEEEGLVQAATTANIDDIAYEKPIKITAVDPKSNTRTTFDISLSNHFIRSCAFFQKLHLRPGDAIELPVAKMTLETVLEFYEVEKNAPHA